MKQSIIILAALSCAFVLTSCDSKTDSPYEQYDKYVNEVVKPSSESSSPIPRSNDFYERLLEAFCSANYSKYIPGKYYEGTITVKNVAPYDTHTMFIKGSLAYKGRFGKKHGDKDFEALVIEAGNGRYHVEFQRSEHVPGQGNNTYSTGLKLFEYSE